MLSQILCVECLVMGDGTQLQYEALMLSTAGQEVVFVQIPLCQDIRDGLF